MAFSKAERLSFTVRWLAREKGVNQSEIGQLLGYNNQSYWSQLMRGFKPPAADLPGRIAALDPRININFLLGTSDDLLLPGNAQPELKPFRKSDPDTKPTVPADGIFIPAELAQLFTDLAATVRSQQETIRLQQETIRRGLDLQKAGGNAG